MEFKGSKGFWNYSLQNKSNGIEESCIGATVTDEEGFELCAIFNDTDWAGSKWQSNAKLIAAAPELLEALKEMVRMYEAVQPSGGWQGQYDLAVLAIEKALK